MRLKQIALIEPFYADSHKEWADSLANYSKHEFTLFTLSGKFWKWRMHGGAVTLAEKVNNSDVNVDLFLVTDMLDVATFKALLADQYKSTPILLYFHENQLTYPWSPNDEDPSMERDRHYAWINYTSCLVADRIYFNSSYHLNSFISALPDFLRAFPDYRGIETISGISNKSKVLNLGMNFDLRGLKHPSNKPTILWNHRWEYDKNPDLFFKGLEKLKNDGKEFSLIVCGRSYPMQPAIFEKAKKVFKNEIVHWGYAKDKEAYLNLIKLSDVLPVTSHQDFFGISVVEAIYYGVMPILPQRLAYPDYIDVQKYSDLYYRDDAQFTEKLSQIIKQWPSSYVNISEEVEAFDWNNCISQYDYHLET